MAKTKKFLITIISALCLACVLLAGKLAVRLSNEKAGATTALLALDLDETYYLGDSLEIPETAQIEVGGESLVGNSAKLIMPDGVVYGSGTYTLNKAGTYSVIYYATKGTETVSASKSFVACGYNWESQNSEMSYGELKRGKGEGVIVNLNDGDVFRLNTVKDISGIAELEVCKINPDIRPEKTGTPTAALVIVRVVDAYNPEVFVEFYLWAQSSSVFYVGCGANNQSLVGMERHSGGGVKYEGELYKAHKMLRYATSAVYGQWINVETSQGLANYGGMSYIWNLGNNKVHFKGGSRFVNDLDAPEIYGENIFSGFSSGYVYAEIQCYGYSKSSINIEIESLLGITGEDLMKSPAEDVTPPLVKVDTETTNEDGVYVVKGKKYSIPQNVTVNDFNYNGNLTKRVYYNYGSMEEVEIYLQDGAFIPTLAGRYTVEYKAIDTYGNEGVFLLPLNVVEAEDTITHAQDKLDELYVAQKVYLPAIEGTGVNKEVQVEISVTNPKEQTKILDDSRDYVVEYAGAHTITYTFRDNVYTKTFSYTVNAEDNGSALFNDTPKLPAYFIKGATYLFEDYMVYTAGTDGLTPSKATMQIAVNDGAFADVDVTQAYKVTASKNVRIKYVYNEQETDVLTIPVVDVGYAGTRSYEKYFQGTYDRVTSNPLAITYFFDGAESEGSLTFVNTLSLAKFSFGFATAEGQDNFDSLTISLTDYANADNKISISYQNLAQAGQMVYSVKQWQNRQLIVDYSAEVETKMSAVSLSVFQKENRIVNNVGANPVDIIPFENDLAIFTIDVSGIDGETRLDVKSINNQNISSRIKEQVPQLKYFGATGVYNVGDSFVIQPAIISSVFNVALKTDIKMSVHSPIVGDEEPRIARATDGTWLQNVRGCDVYEVALTEAGTYRVIYNYSCQTKDGVKSDEISFIISVVDNTAPTLNFENGLNEQSLVKVKLNTIYHIPKYVMSDNDTAVEELKHGINVHDAIGIVVANNVETYVFRQAGYYTVRAWCLDTYGNMAVKYYKILVE